MVERHADVNVQPVQFYFIEITTRVRLCWSPWTIILSGLASFTTSQISVGLKLFSMAALKIAISVLNTVRDFYVFVPYGLNEAEMALW